MRRWTPQWIFGGYSERSGFVNDHDYSESLVAWAEGSLFLFWFPLGGLALLGFTVLSREVTTGPKFWVGVAFFVVWAGVALMHCTTRLNVHRDRLSWHTVLDSHVVPWVDVDYVRVVGDSRLVVARRAGPQHSIRIHTKDLRDFVARLEARTRRGELPASLLFK